MPRLRPTPATRPAPRRPRALAAIVVASLVVTAGALPAAAQATGAQEAPPSAPPDAASGAAASGAAEPSASTPPAAPGAGASNGTVNPPRDLQPWPETGPPSGTAMSRPATVNGESITAEDIANHMRLMGEDRTGGSPEERWHTAQRLIAQEILMASEATRLGVELTDREVDEYWTRRRGSVPDYEAMAQELGTTVERQRELGRRAALSELYLTHRVGLRSDLGQKLPPDPLLVRLVNVTPQQLRDAFAANKQHLGKPEVLVCDVWACPLATDVAGLEEALGQGREPDGVAAVRRSFPVPALAQVFPPPLAEFLGGAQPGSLRGAQASDGVLLLKVIERQPGEEAEFATSQESLRRMLQTELLSEARTQIVATLAGQATYWPPYLFAPHAPSLTAPPAAAAAGAAPATPAGSPAPAPDAAGAAPASVAKPGGAP